MERPRVDLRKRLALLDDLPFRVLDLREHTRDLRSHGCRGDRSDGSERFHANGNVSNCCSGEGDGRAGPSAPATEPVRRRLLRIPVREVPAESAEQRQANHDQQKTDEARRAQFARRRLTQ